MTAVRQPAQVWLRGRGRGRRLGSGLSISNRTALIALALVFALALFGSLLAPYSPVKSAGPSLSAPNAHFLLGTDQVGRDILSRILVGIASTWFGALAVVASGVIIGGLVGLLAGMAGGVVDWLLMRLTDLFLALPATILAIVVVAALGPSLLHTLIAIGTVWWPLYARVVRGEVRAIVTRPHIDAARMSKVGWLRMAARHVLPGTFPAVIVTASLDVGVAMLTVATLSFLGLGQLEPAPELGSMTASGLPYLLSDWWIAIMPALVVFLLTLISNFAGDAARDLVGGRR
jgi:peptide/nickel transport system permease protein